MAIDSERSRRDYGRTWKMLREALMGTTAGAVGTTIALNITT
jgi:hypothetical protein